MLVKTIDYSCIHHVWRKYLNTTISRKLVHSTVKITVLSQESLKSWSETRYGYDKKARAVGETSWSTVETFCQKQDYSTLAFLAILVDTISLFYQQIYRWIIRFLSPNMAHTSVKNTYCDIIFLGVLQNAKRKQPEREAQRLLRQSHDAVQISLLQSFQTSLSFKVPRLRWLAGALK